MTEPRQILARLLADAIAELGAELAPDEVSALLAVPPNRELGDLAFPCFQLARSLRQAPPAIAATLVASLQARAAEAPAFASFAAAGPFVNAKLDPADRARRIVTAANDAAWGGASHETPPVLGIDYSSPNIAKPFGIGHLRSTAIGAALRNIYTHLGWKVVGVNHLGDWGTQFGKLMAAFERWGDAAELDRDPISHLYDLYVRFHREVETEPALDDVGRDWFLRLERGDPPAVAYWERFRALSLREFERIYARLGVTFDHYWGEAHYNDKLDAVIEDVERAGLAVTSEGALVVPLDDLDLPPCLIRKSDGATLYATRDLAAARYRHAELGFDRFLYVVGAAQTVHFRQVFAVLERMGYGWASSLVHVPFGLIQGISTRRGTLVFLDDILDRGRDQALEVLRERDGLSDDERAEIAEQVAIGAIVFYDLLRNRMRDYDFDWDQMLRGLRPGEPGKTGPYLQYTHVRLRSVEDGYTERYGAPPALDAIDFALLSDDAASGVVAELERWPAVVRAAADEYEPSEISRYLLDLAAAFNSFYSGGHRIVSDDPALSAARTALVAAVRNTLGIGLALLGVPRPARM